MPREERFAIENADGHALAARPGDGDRQRAALAAFDCGEEIAANIARYARNRELLLEELPKAGFTALAPADGAFYIYADVSHMTNDSQAFCQRMLDETGVAAKRTDVTGGVSRAAGDDRRPVVAQDGHRGLT